MEQKFKIDFFELCFLAEVCIPPTPIARAVFWDRLINEIHNELSENQRKKLFCFIQRRVENLELKKDNENYKWFVARFDPDNQFEIKTISGEYYKCFKKGIKYYVEKNKWIPNDLILEHKKL